MIAKDIDSMSFDELKNEFIQFRKMMMDHKFLSLEVLDSLL